MQLHSLAFLILLHEFWSLTWIDRLFLLLYFVHNFSNFFLQFFWLILFNPWELCLFLKYFYLSLFFFIHFPVFLTQVYRFYRNFLVFNFFHLFSAFLFYATAFLLNFIDYISRKCYLWLQLNSCIHFWHLLKSFFTSLLRNYFRHWGGCFLSIYLYVIYYFTYIRYFFLVYQFLKSQLQLHSFFFDFVTRILIVFTLLYFVF